MNDLRKQAQELLPWSIEKRRHLHQYPEISLDEKQTSQYCQQILQQLGYTITPGWNYGFTADLQAPHATSRVALRADMDALPMQELNQHDFVSKHTGVAHMCGHDVHMAIALTTANLLSTRKTTLKHHVRFVFQPSEEKPPGGAPGMIESGCLEGVTEIYGLHNDPGTPVGQLRTRVGPLTAIADMFQIELHGVGCHAARPQDGLDPLCAAAQLVTTWQSIVARKIDPVHPAVLGVTQFHAGEVNNVIPSLGEKIFPITYNTALVHFTF